MRADPGLVRLAIVGFAGYTFYGLALRGSLGEQGQDWALQLRSAWGGTPTRFISGGSGGTTAQNASKAPAPSGSVKTTPVSTSPSSQRYVNLNLTDVGPYRVPIVYDTQTGAVMQSPSWVSANAPAGYSPNVYRPDDVFLDSTGEAVGYDQALAIGRARTA